MSGMAMAKPQAPPSTSLTVTVDGKTTMFTVADLNAMPQDTVSVHNAHNNMDETYSGVPLGESVGQSRIHRKQDHPAQDAAQLPES